LDQFFSDLSDSFMAELETDSEREERTYQSTLQTGDTSDISHESVQRIEPAANFEFPEIVKDPMPVSSPLNDLKLNKNDSEILQNDSEILQNDSELVLNEHVKPVQRRDSIYFLKRFKQRYLSVFIIYNVFCLILYLAMY